MSAVLAHESVRTWPKKKKKTKQINHHYTLVLSLIKTLSEIMTYQKYYSHDNTVLLTQKYLLVLVLAKGLGFLWMARAVPVSSLICCIELKSIV